MPLPDRPDDWGPLPSWQARRAAAGRHPPNEHSDDDSDTFNDDDDEPQSRAPPQSPPPRPRRSPQQPPHQPHPADTDETPYDPKRWLNNPAFCSLVGRSMSHSLKILGLGLGASEMEIKVRYRQLARKYHPDKTTPHRARRCGSLQLLQTPQQR